MAHHHIAIAVLVAIGFACTAVAADNDDNAAVDATDNAPRMPPAEALALASLLVTNGDLDRAERVVAAIDDDALTDIADHARLSRLRGYLALKAGRFTDAVIALRAAIDQGEQSADVYAQLARAAHGAQQPRAAIAALDDARAHFHLDHDQDPTLVLIRARSEQALGHADRALAALDDGASHFPAASVLGVETVGLLMALDLPRTAATRAALVLPLASVVEARVLVDHVRVSATGDEGLAVAEAARLRFVDDVILARLLARAFVDRDRPLSAALVMEPIARRDRTLATDTAELFRRAGQPEAALQWNASAPDGEAKLRQRFSILVDSGRYETAAALAPRLQGRGLTDDADVAYALAWTFFQTGRFTEADGALARIDDPRRFADATTLRQAIAACVADPRRCP